MNNTSVLLVMSNQAWAVPVVRPFLANMLSSIGLSSVTFVRPTQAIEIFGNVSTPFNTLAIHWHPGKILRRSSQGNPSVGGVKHKRDSRI